MSARENGNSCLVKLTDVGAQLSKGTFSQYNKVTRSSLIISYVTTCVRLREKPRRSRRGDPTLERAGDDLGAGHLLRTPGASCDRVLTKAVRRKVFLAPCLDFASVGARGPDCA